LCHALLRDGAEAEDAAQQVFLAAHRALLNGTTPREPAAWLATIARNECWARIRARMREPLPSDEVDGAASLSDPLAEAIRNADLAALWSAVAELPRRQRDALLLREFGGLSYEELAGALAVSGPAVESLLFRARQSMRTRLEAAYAGLTGASWIEALSRLAGGLGGGMAPVAAKVAAVGVGAAVATGGAVVAPTMLEHARHDRPASSHTTRTPKAKRPARVAQQLQVFVARTTPAVVAPPTRDVRDRHDSSGPGRSGGEDGGVRGDDRSGRHGSAGPGSSGGSDGSGDVRETTESTSRNGRGDGSGSSSEDRSSGDGDGSAASGGGSSPGSGASSGGHGSSGHGSSGAESGGDRGSDGSHGSRGDSGSDGGGVSTTIPNPVVTATVASGDAPPTVGAPSPGDDG
jgi:RNA polymerase sigma factor (sigma-70 family)